MFFTGIILGVIIFCIYITAVCIAFGVPKSISDTWYLLQSGRLMDADLSMAFTMFCFSITILILPGWIEVTKDSFKFLPFLSASALSFVGAAPMFKESLQRWVHFIASGICAAGAITWILVCTNLWLIPTFVFVALAPMFIGRKWMFWLEIAAFVSLLTSLLITYKLWF